MSMSWAVTRSRLPAFRMLPSRMAPTPSIAPDLADVELHPLDGERRGPGDDPDPLEAGQGVDELLGQALAEIILVLGRAHIGEGKDGHRRKARRRRPVLRGGFRLRDASALESGQQAVRNPDSVRRRSFARHLRMTSSKPRRDVGPKRRRIGRIFVQDLVRRRSDRDPRRTGAGRSPSRKRVQPNDQMSVRASVFSPRTCSGDM